ncbi:protein phosphatase 2C domain-containing protein [Cyanobium sp. BA5m-10]|uniref:PP2C family serine/threonine-protein phosphatase n=1 Tax=Cyanobium sp. BA5m-10 TaxID=2823705 RepID=UPI0020CB8929|nr:PP2C family serine/threonine-protein phosphatase [Cyanobium sp. BA5m-10]MCP9904693.1 protein phosphatase 2C domain-containing protein [Cyanobium sp. BA5m-10]
MSSWFVPEVNTRTGASHARRGVVCQDASGWCSLKDRSGHPVQLMVVADGHGGKRYIHSDVGSRLACELSLNLVAEQLGQSSSVGRDAVQRWQEWLEGSFAQTLHRRWLAAVEAHWNQERIKTEASEDPYSPLSYGTTIALVIMTPDWWGHTGLGDWDLVRIGSDGEVELASEEQEEDQTGGETTYSLCLSNAPRHFVARTAVHPITEQETPFSLLLSTDGVRKSCSTDADFFAIVRYLCEAEQPRQGDAAVQLSSDLDRISSQGSGDDVSVAIGRWRVVSEKPHLSRGARHPKQGLQPSQLVIVQPCQEKPLASTSAAKAEAIVNTDLSPTLIQGGGSKNNQISENCLQRHIPWPIVALVVIVVAAIGATAGIAWKGLGPFTRANKSNLAQKNSQLVAALQNQSSKLCNSMKNAGSPAFPPSPRINDELINSIAGQLSPYKRIFKDTLRDTRIRNIYLAMPSKDPLGALIASSNPELEQPQLVEFCPELREALSREWQRARIDLPAAPNGENLRKESYRPSAGNGVGAQDTTPHGTTPSR